MDLLSIMPGLIMITPFMVCGMTMVLHVIFFLFKKPAQILICKCIYYIMFLIYWAFFILFWIIDIIMKKEYLLLVFAIPFIASEIYIAKKLYPFKRKED